VFRRSTIAALLVGVICTSMAGLYVRRHAASLASPFAVHHETNQVAIAAAASEIVSPPEHSQTATAAVNEQSVLSGDNLAVARGIELRREAPPPATTTMPDAPPASARQETSALALPRSANQTLSPPLAVVSPVETASTRIDPLATSVIETSSREKSDGSGVPSTPQSMAAASRAPLEALVVPSTAANPVTPIAATSLTTARERAAEAAPIVVAVADEQRIAAVLKRFTDAYTQLNVPAARAVWPSVDGRALARAFDALASQSIAFDDCTVHVSGAEARAACVGNLTYVPKIGRRSARTVSQHWNFVMNKSPEGWTITDAQMR
jgi:hypothetical protein